MTIKQTLDAIRSTGAVASWQSAVKEFRVNIPKGTEKTAYYTPDAHDAIGTAQAMMAHHTNPTRW